MIKTDSALLFRMVAVTLGVLTPLAVMAATRDLNFNLDFTVSRPDTDFQVTLLQQSGAAPNWPAWGGASAVTANMTDPDPTATYAFANLVFRAKAMVNSLTVKLGTTFPIPFSCTPRTSLDGCGGTLQVNSGGIQISQLKTSWIAQGTGSGFVSVGATPASLNLGALTSGTAVSGPNYYASLRILRTALTPAQINDPNYSGIYSAQIPLIITSGWNAP